MSVLIGVGARVADVRFQALHFDGQTAQPRRVALRVDDEARAIVEVGEAVEVGGGGQDDQASEAGLSWPFDTLRVIAGRAGDDQMILRPAGNAVERLLITDPEAQRVITARAPDLTRRPPVPGVWRLWAWVPAAIGSVALIILVLIPLLADQLAEFLPPEGERALGEATFEQIRTALDQDSVLGLETCEDSGGLAALAKMEERLLAQTELPTELTVHVLDAPIVNAFALPGGYVVFFEGLIREAETPEEVAAVFAHEVGHVAARDPTRIALRSAGSIGVLGLLLGDFAGGAAVLFLAESVIRADYTQEAEAAADAFAHRMLLEAGLPPAAIATFFERLAAQYDDPPDIVQHFLSHPAMGDRIAAARDATPENFSFDPVLTETEWQALKEICGRDLFRPPSSASRLLPDID